MRKIVVTGATGVCGRVIQEHLSKAGYETMGADVVPGARPGPFGLRCLETDLSDFGQTVGALEGAYGVIHFAAIRADNVRPPSTTFANNVVCAFNVLEACRVLGIKRLVVASSIMVHGRPPRFDYVPVDEQHPPSPESPYGLSKFLAEQACEAYHRMTGMGIATFRLPFLLHPEMRSTLLPQWWEHPQRGANFLWAYVDGRDVAEACRLAIEADLHTHESFWLTAADTLMKTATQELLRRYRPEITDLRAELPGNATLINDAKIRRVLKFTPRYRWRDYYDSAG